MQIQTVPTQQLITKTAGCELPPKDRTDLTSTGDGHRHNTNHKDVRNSPKYKNTIPLNKLQIIQIRLQVKYTKTINS